MLQTTGRLGNEHEPTTINPGKGFKAKSIEDAPQLPDPDDGTETVEGFSSMPILLRDRVRCVEPKLEVQKPGQI